MLAFSYKYSLYETEIQKSIIHEINGDAIKLLCPVMKQYTAVVMDK